MIISLKRRSKRKELLNVSGVAPRSIEKLHYLHYHFWFYDHHDFRGYLGERDVVQVRQSGIWLVTSETWLNV